MADVILSERTVAAVEYPSSDGKPVAESDFQLTVLTYAREALRIHFRAREDVYVAANLLIYYREGDEQVRVAPDVFVVVGASNHERSSYLLWQEPKVPDWVLEITSRSTRAEDQGRKRELYRRLGVAEYWQYDPTGDYLRPALQGLELVAGEYEELPWREQGDGTRVMASAGAGVGAACERERAAVPRSGDGAGPADARGERRRAAAGGSQLAAGRGRAAAGRGRAAAGADRSAAGRNANRGTGGVAARARRRQPVTPAAASQAAELAAVTILVQLQVSCEAGC